MVKKYICEADEIKKEVLKASIKICERRLLDLDDIIDMKNPPKTLVSEEEWDVIAKDELNECKLAKKKHKDWLKRMDCWRVSQHPKKAKKEEKKGKKIKPKKSKKAEVEEVSDDDDEILKEKCTDILDRLTEKFVQYELNGINNIWICKPAGLSRGRGIDVFASLVEILDNCHREGQWVAQKYMENPMIIQGRKFDIRQWVLVTSWNPLTIWFWNKPYIRFPAADYDPNNLNDRCVHLTNNSVAKYAKNTTEMGQGNMWDVETFAGYLQTEYGEEKWEEGGLRKRCQQVIKNTLESVQDMFDENNRKATCTELYGFDLMLDEDCNPWLLEVNSSPTMEFSTPITEYLCQKVMEDTVKVIVDYHYSKKKSKIDTGDWELICKKKQVESNPQNACGLNFVCEGTKLKVKKQRKAQPTHKKIPVVNIIDQIKETNEDEICEEDDESSDEEADNDNEDSDGEGEDNEAEGENDEEDQTSSAHPSPIKQSDAVPNSPPKLESEDVAPSDTQPESNTNNVVNSEADGHKTDVENDSDTDEEQ